MGPLRADPVGFQQITNLTAATKLTVPTGGADFAVIRATTANVFWRDDGIAPTSTVGMPILYASDPPFEYFGNVAGIQFISATGAINVSYYRISG